MTCKTALDIIDAGPFAEISSAQRNDFEHHVRECAACGQALLNETTLSGDLAMLSQTEAPASLATVVMARIEGIEPDQTRPARAAAAFAWMASRVSIAAAVGIVSWVRVDGAGVPTMVTGIALIVSLVLYVVALFAPRVDPLRALKQE